jgi:isoleucyl-tRNA synthetase
MGETMSVAPDPNTPKERVPGTPEGTPAPTQELKATLTLPETKFPMKANLPQNEPLRLKQWKDSGLYDQIREARKGSEKYILHYGPPYANGPIHLGHALQKCIKDFILKSKTMSGFDAPLIPGWDCHGLPIEIKVDEKLGRKKLEMPVLSVLRACREYAQKFIDLQRSQLVRLGVFARWDDPYLTMSKQYEARTLDAFYSFFEKGYVYKGLKPVYWCMHDRTALAEAEVEYEMHTSPSVYVRYPLTSDAGAIDPALAGKKVYTIIWTTTPWTLPASLAVAFHPEFDYVALENTDGNIYIVAEALAAAVREACKLEGASEIAKFKGSRLDRVTFQHPFLDRSILGVNADYVTADTGTGAVHTAPSHGVDDFNTGSRYGLDQTCNVDNEGRLRNGLPEYDGLAVFEANPEIIKLLEARGALMGRNDIYHSYPHCWRCHNPVIFRATEQWFIGLETPLKNADGTETTYRQRALDAIKRVTWDPTWGEDRISNMIATRPDWCISRQRIWGVPIAVFLCNECHAPLNNPAINRRVVKLFEEDGAEAWHKHTVEELLPAGTTCASCGAMQKESGKENVLPTFRKEMDILDVWFDSGTSWHAVLETEPSQSFPADLYIEGADQHRGWFHSSLLCAVAIRETAPYKKVATSGWTLDEQGRAFSKSLGNGVDPVDIAERLGAEIVRLWAASVDFREDVSASENLMQRAADNYRKLRNTFKFLLGNLNGFDPARDAVSDAELLPLDRYMLARTRELTGKVLAWYEQFEFHRVYQAINEFTIVDLSSLYLDVLKDRMYTFAPSSVERRSAQTVMWRITETLVRLVAPMLSFTADEVWSYLPQVEGREASVHLALFPKNDAATIADDEALLAEWRELLSIREEAMKSLEEARKDKRIGKALEAKVRVAAGGKTLALLQRYSGALKELFNVSAVEVASAEGDAITATTLPADGTKCERCWNYYADDGPDHVRQFGPWANVCGRCANALQQMGHKEEVHA